jgi:hypothetical protein
MRALALAALLASACNREPPPPRPARAAAAATVDGGLAFLDESFDEIYPVFLLRKVAPGPKAALWARYSHRWVRWRGTLVSFTQNGATFRQIPSTVTFDVSLYVDAAARPRLRQLKVGQEVVYVGQLDSFDDIFRTLYLVHGDVVVPPAGRDAGP